VRKCSGEFISVLSPIGLGERYDNCVQVLVGSLEGKGHLEDLIVDGKMIIKLILKNRTQRELDWYDVALDRRHVASFCEHNYEHSPTVRS